MLMFVLALLVAKLLLNYAQNIAPPRIIPSTLQLFEYKPINFTCEGFGGQSVVKNNKEFNLTCSKDCTFRFPIYTDSGEYWCEGDDGHRSNTVNITVTGGSVILESPVLPVMEGEAVTLRCRHKNALLNLPVNFYKDGLFVRTGAKGQVTILNVSKSDEGNFSCNMSGSEGSAGSRLTVWRNDDSKHQEEAGSVILVGPVLPVMEGDAVTLRCQHRKTSSKHPAHFYKDGVFLWSSFSGELSILSVSVSDEGLYSCSISGFGGSAASQLTVRQALPSHPLLILLWLVIVLLVVLLLSVMGLLHYIKRKVSAQGDLSADTRMKPYTLT